MLRSWQGRWNDQRTRPAGANLFDKYHVMRHLDDALHLIGAYISPLPNASTHVNPDRTLKLLFHTEKIRKLIGRVERAGHTLIQLHLHYSQGHIQLEIELAKGK